MEKKSSESGPQGRYLLALSLTALGVVYGDIGTSPLYAFRECFFGEHAIPVTVENIFGVLSLIFWSLILVISIKYLIFILMADNEGEGGILALTALVTPVRASAKGGRWLLIVLGLFGAALLYGDGMITPAISVLSAVEGLRIVTPLFDPYVIPLTIVIIIALFVLQSRGTASVGALFGPVTLVWFLVLALLGLHQIVLHPAVLAAANPLYAIRYFLRNGWSGVLVLGAVFLVVTGGEALYADMGHFGSRPIRIAWFSVVLPALLLNYFGQGALLVSSPAAAASPFYHLVPSWGLVPLVILATAATVIASQAIISGAFSLTMQAVQLGYSPRLDIQHTSAEEKGQIYLPAVNTGLMVACIGLVLGFRSSSNLAAAYGVAVTTTMVITTILFYLVVRNRWHWRLPFALGLCGLFLVVDLMFFGANMLKIPHGGWFPLLIAGIIFTLMATWKRGRSILAGKLEKSAQPVEGFLTAIRSEPPARVPGTAIFMTGNPWGTPPALLHNLKHNKVLHQRVVMLMVETEEVPHVPAAQRVAVEDLGEGIYRLVIRYGFMEEANISRVLRTLEVGGEPFKPMETSFFLGRETLIIGKRGGMSRWRKRLFIGMSRNARSATSFFDLPANAVVELGAHIEL